MTICEKDLMKSMQFRQLSKIDPPIVKDLGNSHSRSRNSFSPCTSSLMKLQLVFFDIEICKDSLMFLQYKDFPTNSNLSKIHPLNPLN